MAQIVIDDRDFQQGLAQALADLDQEFLTQERARAERTRSRAQALAPKDTGEGAASIGVTEGTDSEGQRYIEVGTDVEHMFYQEFGTSVDPPRPHMRPAIAENSD